MDVNIEIIRRMKLRLQSRMLLWCLSNVYLSAIGTKELADALSAEVRALVDCGGSRAGALIVDTICSRRHLKLRMEAWTGGEGALHGGVYMDNVVIISSSTASSGSHNTVVSAMQVRLGLSNETRC
jgi:hypothetical protein